jgi:acetyltransferase
METPPSLPQDFEPNVELARKLVRSVVAQGRSWLDPIEVACLLRAYKIPITSATLAHTPEQAGLQAKSLLAAGTRVVVKVLSPDILYKSEVGGVRLGLTSPEAVEGAAAALMSEARAANPMARIEGVTVHPMIVRPKARELIVSIADDPTFGPVIVFGSGGTAVKVVGDLAVELPPLDLKLARDLVARTHVSRLLHAYGDVPSADLDAVALVLVKLAQLAADLPEIRELDLNPLLADENGVVALDARVSVRPVDMASTGRSGNPRFAIRAYPKEWERRGTLSDQTEIFIRPIRPEDQPLYARFFAGVTPEDIRLRFFGPIREFSHSFTARFTQIDYARAMAFIALHQDSGELLGVTRLHADSSYDTAEYAILVRSDYKGRGLGSKLMAILLEYARSEGLRVITGQVLATNTTMLRMCTALGFSVARHCEDGDVCVVSLTLDQKGPQPCRDARSSPANMT